MANFIHDISVRYHFAIGSHDPVSHAIPRVVEHEAGVLLQLFSF